jgi:Kdo2-lipid IVA lauroyltransferase/acyltransferase
LAQVSSLWNILSVIPLPILKAFSIIGSKIHYLIDKKHVKECERMVVLSDIDSDPKKVIAGMYDHIWKTLPEIFWASKVSQEEYAKRVHGYEGLIEYIEQNYKDQSILFLTAHYGAWELVPHTISKMITPILCNYKPTKYQWVNNFIKRARTQKDFTNIEKDGSIVKIFKQLKKGHSAGMVIDQHGGDQGVISRFLGVPCKSWDIMATLSSRANCPIIPVVIIRESQDYKFLWEKAIQPIYDDNKKLDIEQTTLLIDNTFSDFIRKAPEQWMWLGRRWGRDFENLMREDK